MKYNKILLKLSGEALMGTEGYGIDADRLQGYAEEIKAVHQTGVQIGIVFGGGNIFRGLKGVSAGYDRKKGDYMGMLATVINGLAIQSALEKINVPATLLTAFGMEPVGARYTPQRMNTALAAQEVVIFTAGTGNPYFTTDTASALRAVEMQADILLKGTRVDGIYTADPEKDPKASKFDNISFDQVYEKGLQVMDLTAFTMCKENNLPILVFDMNTKGNLQKVMQGDKIGTLVH